MSRIEQALEKAAILRERAIRGEIRPLPPATASAPPHQPISGDVGYPVPSEPVDIKASPFVITLDDPHSPVTEEYRKLKTLLVGLTKQESFQNTIIVTSTVGGEGKSITALNLAITLAQEHDHTVLLVDADLRKPSLHHYLGLQPERGLADCIVNGTDMSELIIRTGIGKLSFLPAGNPMLNPAELFSSQKMADLIEEMKHRYPDRYIIIDTPPVLPFAETHSLGRITDGVVFVVREGTVALNDIHEALHSLKETRILGIVYNEASVTPINNRYYSYYQGHGGSPVKPDSASHEVGARRGLLARVFRRH